MLLKDLKVGDKVCYIPEYLIPTKGENGIVKEIPEFVNDPKSFGFNKVRVVYHCKGDWDNYKDSVSALTPLKDLHKGWR